MMSTFFDEQNGTKRRNLTKVEIKNLRNANSTDEWNKIADQIYKDCGFQYPHDWSDKVLFGKIVPKYMRTSISGIHGLVKTLRDAEDALSESHFDKALSYLQLVKVNTNMLIENVEKEKQNERTL